MLSEVLKRLFSSTVFHYILSRMKAFKLSGSVETLNGHSNIIGWAKMDYVPINRPHPTRLAETLYKVFSLLITLA